jgi:hypothetical protein
MKKTYKEEKDFGLKKHVNFNEYDKTSFRLTKKEVSNMIRNAEFLTPETQESFVELAKAIHKSVLDKKLDFSNG